jgi:hypothetical protein
MKEIYSCQCDDKRSSEDRNANTGIHQDLHRRYMVGGGRCENNTGTTNQITTAYI